MTTSPAIAADQAECDSRSTRRWEGPLEAKSTAGAPTPYADLPAQTRSSYIQRIQELIEVPGWALVSDQPRARRQPEFPLMRESVCGIDLKNRGV